MQSQAVELGRSIVRLSWAMTLFGAQQAARLAARPAAGEAGPVEALDAVARAVEGQFGGVFRGAYEVGQSWLRSRQEPDADRKP